MKPKKQTMENTREAAFDKLFGVIGRHVDLSINDRLVCQQEFESISISKGSIISAKDSIPSHLYFVASGYMRLFYFDYNGEEVTTRISCPGDFIASFLSLIHNQPSSENVQSITDCVLLQISRKDLERLIKNNDRFKEFSLIIFEHALSSGSDRANQLATLDAEDRYKNLMRENSDLIAYVPVQYIASYLGIKPQSLSRIRRKVFL